MKTDIFKKAMNRLFSKDVRVLHERNLGKYNGEKTILPDREDVLFDAVNIDIKNACNLRCRFCFNCFGSSIGQLSPEQLKAVAPILDYAKNIKDGPGCGVYLSCLYEPTIAGNFPGFLESIPESGRDKCFFTSNFARPMNEEYIRKLLSANVHHINISIETLDRERYKTITSMDCFDSFRHNLDLLKEVYAKKEGYKPGLRFITMVLQENKDELGNILRFCHEELHAAEHELRTPYLSMYDNMAWNKSQLLPREELEALREKIAGTGYPLAMDLRPVKDLEILEGEKGDAGTVSMCAATEKHTEEAGTILRNELSEDVFKEMKLCTNSEYLFVRILPDGTITENATGITEPLPPEETASGYYKKKVHELYRRRADAFICPLVPSYKEKAVAIDLDMMLEKAIVNDAYIQLTGWCRIPKDIPEDSVMVFCPEEETPCRVPGFLALVNERPDVPVSEGKRAIGFTTFITKEDISADALKFSVIFAGRTLSVTHRWNFPYAVRLSA